MLITIAYLCVLKAMVIIPLDVLYERETEDVVDKVHLRFVQQLVDRYNFFLKPSEISIALENVRSLTSYKNDFNGLELFTLARTDQLENREAILEKKEKSTILIVETDFIEDITLKKNGICKTSYITSFTNSNGYSKDTLTAFVKAFRMWLSSVINFNVPDIFDLDGETKMKEMVHVIEKASIKSEIKKCLINSNPTKDTLEHGNVKMIRGLLEEILALINNSNDKNSEHKRDEEDDDKKSKTNEKNKEKTPDKLKQNRNKVKRETMKRDRPVSLH